MATTISNGESGSSVRTKLNNIWEGLQINEIDTSIADTAVDVFVYDTSKDSDGGAWRKRTQHTSWYNETLNTTTRGSRKEFPAVAVIVAESTQVTIYDGDDPDLPMWMVINAGGGDPLYGGAQVTSCAALNGSIYVGVGVTAAGSLSVFEFIKDQAYLRINTTSTYNLVTIAKRNNGYASDTITGTAPAIVNRYVNDVAMTVLPNAPIDAATGLPVPTIAVATDGGVSVIKDDGTVVDITAGSYSVSGLVAFTKEQNLLYGFDFSADRSRYIHIQNIPTADTNIGTYGYERGSDDLEFYTSRPESNPDLFVAKYLASVEQFSFAGDYVGGNVYGLAKLDRNQSDPDKGMVAFIDAEHNTGYQVGDIKLATLSDTDATNVTGSELVTNGTFDTDSDWNKIGSVTISGGIANLTSTGGYSNRASISQDITLVSGKTYVLSLTTTGSNYIYIEDGFANTLYGGGNLSITFTATASGSDKLLQVYNQTAGTNTVDNISVRLAEEDRSVNGNGLQVFGTVTKSAVATGADLVAYSGFSTDNYLQQPYNSDLDFGTGDFCISFWAKEDGVDQNITYFAISDASGSSWGTNGYIAAKYNSSTDKYEFLANGGTATTGAIGRKSGWTNFVYMRTNGVLKIYINGVEQGSVSNTSSLGATNTAAHLVVGSAYYNSSLNGSSSPIALFRASATAPSPEAIKRIYEDEKVLFQENAKATLYGSSDAVTALAYDDSTKLLHVGTSDGRSVFQGLKRVDNTTTAVGAAISASNGLVADE